MCVIVRRDKGRGTAVKENNDDGWSSNDVVLWLERRQNEDVVEWWEECPRLRWHFYSSGGWELDCSRRVAGGGSAYLILWFWLEKGRRWDEALLEDEADATSSSWLHGKKAWHGTTRGDVDWRRGVTREEKGGDDDNWTNVNLTGPKNKINPLDRFSWYKWTMNI
jgi:hypothetical protein